jgi:hypothetical protein
MHRFLRIMVPACLGAALLGVSVPPPAASADTFVQQAATNPVYKVTMVARSCAQYTDVFANRARNNIMESLRDLGPNTPYNPFVQVLPSVEDGLAPQSTCTPLPNWTFTFGTGIARPVPGTNLSYVTGQSTVANRSVTTAASTPLLDSVGNPTGTSIAGAATFTLTQTEVSLAQQGSRFWTQGGTSTDPLNQAQFPDEYGFAALRCATDNLNGDNVEWIGFPNNVRHVFCYAFYITPPPGAGTVVIEKQVTTPIDVTAPFDFTGNLSFNPGGRFTLKVPPTGPQVAAQQFVRAETTPTTPWVVTEDVADGFQLDAINCSSSLGASGSTAVVNLGAATVNIFLQEGETVTCRFVNSVPPPPPGEGRVVKLLIGPPEGIPDDVLPTNWSFPWTSPGSTPASGTLDVPALADRPSGDSGFITGLVPGTWTVSEQLPAPTPGWRWEFVEGECISSDGSTATIAPDAGTGAPTGRPVLPSAGSSTCIFVNRLVPTGGIIIRLTTRGGVGSFGFVVNGVGAGKLQQPIELVQGATTTAPDTRVVATGASTDPLIGQFLITPIRPATSPAGRWVVEGLPVCNVVGAPALNIGPEQLQVVAGNVISPVVTCDYVYRFLPPSTLDLSKNVTGNRAGQTGPVIITANCSDGSSALLQVDPADPVPARLPTRLSFLDPVTCAVAETSNGGAAAATVTTSSSVTSNGSSVSRPLTALAVGSDTASEAVEVAFVNDYQLPIVQPPPPPTTVPPIIPPTGSNPVTSTLLVLAGFALLLGSAARFAARRRCSAG